MHTCAISCQCSNPSIKSRQNNIVISSSTFCCTILSISLRSLRFFSHAYLQIVQMSKGSMPVVFLASITPILCYFGCQRASLSKCDSDAAILVICMRHSTCNTNNAGKLHSGLPITQMLVCCVMETHMTHCSLNSTKLWM